MKKIYGKWNFWNCISNIIKINKLKIINRSLKGFKGGPEFPACEGLNISCILEFFTSWL
jgi:hypothetical protein